MKLLRKIWFRAIFCLIGGGLTAELLHISTGDPNRPMAFNASIPVAIILFVAITIGIYVYDNYKIKSKNS